MYIIGVSLSKPNTNKMAFPAIIYLSIYPSIYLLSMYRVSFHK